jgi:CTD kinase subunit gamma
VTLNAKINILYFVDSLCEACLLIKTRNASASSKGAIGAEKAPSSQSMYLTYVARDLVKIVEAVVPEGRQGLPNLVSTKQVSLPLLFFWKLLFNLSLDS